MESYVPASAQRAQAGVLQDALGSEFPAIRLFLYVLR